MRIYAIDIVYLHMQHVRCIIQHYFFVEALCPTDTLMRLVIGDEISVYSSDSQVGPAEDEVGAAGAGVVMDAGAMLAIVPWRRQGNCC